MAITAATIIKGLYEAPGLIDAAKGLIGMLRGGSDKDEAARDIANVVNRSERRQAELRRILKDVGESVDPAVVSLCQHLLNESAFDNEELLGVAERLSGKKAPESPTTPKKQP